ncbi:hypothetical protein VHEMI01613 [[Torrubiella] hemipterigena]|uniref:2EXR domain-containing protein n=1 Tax=[Torrubiella] hemipterigena TaxID=1531966 RepID=A0A0A1STJ2_9HYPO|nr:hypothetical protein VHEMI01613 [[Torrubiella] hemipterigena]
MTCTFHAFPRLPVELQIAIWQATVEPREICFDVDIISTPPALQACQLARETLLQEYELLVVDAAPKGDSPRAQYVREHGRRKTWFNYKLDTLRVDQFVIDDLIDTMGNEKLRRIIIEHSWYGKWYRDHDKSVRLFRAKNEKYFPNIELVKVVEVTRAHTFGPPSPAWRSSFYPIMGQHYYTCSPAKFELEVSHEAFPDMEPLTRHNYVRWYDAQEIHFWRDLVWAHDGCEHEEPGIDRKRLLRDNS